MDPDQTAPMSSLIKVLIVCNIGHQSIQTEGREQPTIVMNSRKRPKVKYSCGRLSDKYGPRHKKIGLQCLPTTKAQTSLHIHAV